MTTRELVGSTVNGRRKSAVVLIPPDARGRRVVAKSCDKCGNLRLAADYDQYDPRNPTRLRGHCKDCRNNMARERERAKGVAPLNLALRVTGTLLAATCGTCGELQDGQEFRRGTSGAPITYRCKACRRTLETSAKDPDPIARRSNQKRLVETHQAETLPRATRYGYQWTGPELEIALREDLTAIEAAKMLGRTFHAVRAARHKARREPKWRDVVGVPQG